MIAVILVKVNRARIGGGGEIEAATVRMGGEGEEVGVEKEDGIEEECILITTMMNMINAQMAK